MRDSTLHPFAWGLSLDVACPFCRSLSKGEWLACWHPLHTSQMMSNDPEDRFLGFLSCTFEQHLFVELDSYNAVVRPINHGESVNLVEPMLDSKKCQLCINLGKREILRMCWLLVCDFIWHHSLVLFMFFDVFYIFLWVLISFIDIWWVACGRSAALQTLWTSLVFGRNLDPTPLAMQSLTSKHNPSRSKEKHIRNMMSFDVASQSHQGVTVTSWFFVLKAPCTPMFHGFYRNHVQQHGNEEFLSFQGMGLDCWKFMTFDDL